MLFKDLIFASWYWAKYDLLLCMAKLKIWHLPNQDWSAWATTQIVQYLLYEHEFLPAKRVDCKDSNLTVLMSRLIWVLPDCIHYVSFVMLWPILIVLGFIMGPVKKHKIVIIFLPIHLNICFGCSKEPSHWGVSFEYPEHMFWFRNKKKSNFQLCCLIWRPDLYIGTCTVVQILELREFQPW